MIIHAVRAVMPTATVGLELMVDTKRVVSDRNRVTNREVRPGTAFSNSKTND